MAEESQRVESDDEKRGKFRGLARAIDVIATKNSELIAAGQGSPVLVEIAQTLYAEAMETRPL